MRMYAFELHPPQKDNPVRRRHGGLAVRVPARAPARRLLLSGCRPELPPAHRDVHGDPAEVLNLVNHVLKIRPLLRLDLREDQLAASCLGSLTHSPLTSLRMALLRHDADLQSVGRVYVEHLNLELSIKTAP